MLKLSLKKTLRFFSLVAVLPALMVASPSTKAEGGAFGVSLSPNAHLYGYFIINGMARGALLTGKLQQKDLQLLVQADETARKIVLHNLNMQTTRSDFQADQALAYYLNLLP